MTNAPIVTLRDVGKRYVKYDDAPTLVAGLLRLRRGSRRSKLWALRHVDLEAAPGEAVGVIGRNGAGKSTMLAMLAGVTAPTEGVVSVRGRVAPLLRLGVGFHEQLTGRENVYINGTILGLSEPEIDKRFDEIVAFAELEDFIDTPVKFYSSGMLARLGFSVAVASRPDVLLVDEILAVGDMTFQIRSFDRMIQLREEGSTVLVVSHNLEAVGRMCARVLLLHDGAPRFLGPTAEAISEYHELMKVDIEGLLRRGPREPGEESELPLEVLSAQVLDEQGAPTAYFNSGTRATVRLRVHFRRVIREAAAGVFVMNEGNELVYRDTRYGLDTAGGEAGSKVDVDIKLGLHVPTGTYTIAAWIGWGVGPEEQAGAETQLVYVTRGPKRGMANLGASYTFGSGNRGATTEHPP